MITELLNSTLAENLAAALLHSLWQAGLVYLLVKLTVALYPKSNSGFHYAITLGAMLIFLAGNFVTFGFLARVNQTATQVTGVWSNLNMSEVSAIALLNDNIPFTPSDVTPYFILFWWFGIILFSIRFGINLYQTQRLVSSSVLEPSKKLEGIFQALVERLGIKKRIRLILSNRAFSPAVMGVFKPVVLLPIGLVNGLSTAEVEAILIHELNHIRRHDYLVNIMQSMLEVFYFFNPFVWLLSLELREQRENVCDDKTLAMGISRRSYAEVLANIYEYAYQQSTLAMSFAERKNLTLKRIQRIMKTQSTNNRLFGSLFLALAVSLAIYAGAKGPLPSENIPFYTPERIEMAGPVGLTDFDYSSELIGRLKEQLEEKANFQKQIVAQDTIDKEEIERQAREFEQAMERLQSTKEWQELENIRQEMLKQQMTLLQEMQPQIEEALKGVDWTLQLNQEEMHLLQEQLAELKTELGQIDLDEEVLHALEQSARAMEESKVKFEAQFNSEKIAELELMAQKYAAEAIKATADAEVIAREAEKVAAEAMKVARKVEAFMSEIKEELAKDGYLKKSEDIEDLNFDDGKVIVNGKEVKAKDAKKYYQIRKKHLGEDSDFFMNRN